MDPSLYYADSPPTVVKLEIKTHFDALTDQQRLYAHYISRASFLGYRVIFNQVSPESEDIFDLIIGLYRNCHGDWSRLREDTETSADDLRCFLEYAGQFLGNAGNYKGFGDSKFIPKCPPQSIAKLASSSVQTLALWNKVEDAVFADVSKPALMHLGYPDKGHLSNYYPASPSITQEEIESIDKFVASKKLMLENTRLRKLKDGNFELFIASGLSKPPAEGSDVGTVSSWNLEGKLAGQRLDLRFGDHIEHMAKIALHIKKAGLHAANESQKLMMDAYAKSFGTGSMNSFIDSQKLWVGDTGPVVESNVGFIENYRDPAGIRAEWEGFAAIVNVDRTKAFQKLVNAASDMIPKLPWPRDFEKDHFTPPDFTSLEVLSFACSGLPAGINLPNSDEIRQNQGFKNVSLGNVLSAKAPDEPIPFIQSEDLEIYRQYRDAAFEVQVGIHELLGHGTGKLLQETEPGKFNFDKENPPISPVTKAPCKTYYKPSQTWSSVFGPISSSYEECRAECVAMALSCDFKILQIFGFGDGTEDLYGKAGDVLYASYLSMARAGVAALEYWDPTFRNWGQAHMQARYSILQVFLGAGGDFVKLDYSNEDLSDLSIILRRDKIISHGRPAVEDYLQKLHIFKCTADLEAGKELYERMTHVDEFNATRLRAEVLRRKTPRKVFVQANTVEKDGKVSLKEYAPTLEGLVQSFAERDI